MVQRRFLIAAACAASIALYGAAAEAKPSVALALKGSLVEQTAQGPKLVALPAAGLRPGERLRYDIIATNVGTDPTTALVPQAKIPSGTAYAPGSAGSEFGRPEFTLDGKTWSVAPTIVVRTPAGDVVKKADPSTFIAVRWIAAKPLAPKASLDFSYEVRVK